MKQINSLLIFRMVASTGYTQPDDSALIKLATIQQLPSYIEKPSWAGFLFMPGPEIMISKTGICITSYRENIRTLLPHRNHSHELKMAESI